MRNKTVHFIISISFLWYFISPANATPQAVPLSQASLIRVPQDVPTLQQAINQIANGGIIELAAGTYIAPSPEGFEIKNLGKSFTIQASTGVTVTLDGAGTTPIISFLNTDLSAGGLVIFKGLTFANGRYDGDGRAGGVSMYKAQASFINCRFENNVGNQPTTGGGAVLVTDNSTATFSNCTWDSNSAKNEGGAIAINDGASVSIANSRFVNNRTNLPAHRVTAAGGAIHIGNSTVSIYNTEFDGNEAGYVGGAIFAIGNWTDPVTTPRTTVTIDNSTFTNNKAKRDPSVSFSLPTEGGAIHAEDQTTLTISNSTFTGNEADTGGAVNLYRAIVDISRSIFTGNKAVGIGAANGFGAAISAISNDANDSTTNGGTINRRSASLTITDTLLQGLTAQSVGQAGGGIYVAGDSNRMYGQNGVGQMGTVADNRAKVTLNNVIIDNTDVQETSGVAGTGVGGGLLVDLADLTITDTLIIRANANGNSIGVSGGGMAILNQSLANLQNVTIAKSSSDGVGAGVFVQGSEIHANNCNLIENELSPGISEPIAQSYGAAIFAGPDIGRNLPVTGAFENCLISNNIGLPIYDDDRTDGPINDVRYNNNQFYSTTFGDTIYTDSIAGYCCQNTNQLNSLTVIRNNGVNTTKAKNDNTELSQPPVVGTLLAVPPSFPQIASLSAMATYDYYLGYAWSGGAATLDGNPVSGNAGVTMVSDSGSTHTLLVNGTPFTVTVNIILLDQKVYLPVVFR